jgi:RNA polymerase sigma factor (sigma-70 family)
VGRSEAGAAEAAVQVAVIAPGSGQADALLRAARSGDPDAFMRLLAPERPRLESLAGRLLDDSGDVADVLQEVYLSAYRALPRYRGDSRIGTWLYRITYNACLHHASRRSRAVDAGDAHATAWWELQARYYLKPIEGDKTPESPYQQWASVRLVILHGDFPGEDWRYWLLDRDSHNVLSSGRSDTRFKMSGPQLPAPQGPITLGGE